MQEFHTYSCKECGGTMSWYTTLNSDKVYAECDECERKIEVKEIHHKI